MGSLKRRFLIMGIILTTLGVALMVHRGPGGALLGLTAAGVVLLALGLLLRK